MNDLVVIENGQAVVSSRQVAENFGKEHSAEETCNIFFDK